LNRIAPVVLVDESAGVAKNFCALELATTSALQAIFARRALRGMDSEDSGPGRHEKKEQKRGILIRIWKFGFFVRRIFRAMGDRATLLSYVGFFVRWAIAQPCCRWLL
jgi:hypothetical protein